MCMVREWTSAIERLYDSIDPLRDQKEAYQETSGQCYNKKAGDEAQIQEELGQRFHAHRFQCEELTADTAPELRVRSNALNPCHSVPKGSEERRLGLWEMGTSEWILHDARPGCSREYCFIYQFQPNASSVYCLHSDHLPRCADHAAVYTNSVCLPKHNVRYELAKEEVEIGFLSKCTSLRTVDLSPLSHVTEVHERFLEGCSGLSTINLSPFSKLRVIRASFLQGCSGLTSLNLGPLSQVTEIHGGFLSGCSGLTELNLNPLSQVKNFRWGFLAGCSGLTTLDLGPLSNVSKIDLGFLERCTGLTCLDLGPLSQVTMIHSVLFLNGCNDINVVYNPPLLCNVPLGWLNVANQWVREPFRYCMVSDSVVFRPKARRPLTT